eukprot:CAMPEP_0170753234 /NCGR_PEP_ID=MMETSP0437-20130122/12382_1 /TAXON_ID=0 /ORGANISM="Sexangularia sp." /LENGTH=75 /DNA_ID=CAMNT_0011092335 /DNA_START=55 /DNA_END=279 /DNA_ORIENTATION=-
MTLMFSLAGFHANGSLRYCGVLPSKRKILPCSLTSLSMSLMGLVDTSDSGSAPPDTSWWINGNMAAVKICEGSVW